ncbi:uroporphyrinogen-III C-methyltransferase [Microseira sp. BLCC-F43]|jgi:uroporphyrinogen III methyltransferase/synthase|uniref:uroporphyrinogen-III C-methyltransferase n=1 Tax=Microseira sp. BLCC-F43 TaxID=3153602 RepID=UPI0035B88CCD
MFEEKGKVYLVGAGPSDVAYLTVRSQQLLSQAEVLIYDALISERLLDLVPDNCVKFHVGKRGGRKSTPQAEIDRLLVEQCLLGKQVVRLKSGDPLIFGRSSQEIQALIAAGCPFEVVPGISSALAAPLLAGIPLTDPVLSRCFAVLSAHEPTELDWEALSRIDTLVILMGGRNLGEIVRQLHRGGRSLQTPVAVIRYCGHPQQQIWTAQLGTIAAACAGASLSPAVIVIGEVVGLRPYLQPPLAGQRAEMLININGNLVSERMSPIGDNLKSSPLDLISPIAMTQTNNQHPAPETKKEAENQIIPASPRLPIRASSSLPLANKTILVTRSAGQSGEFTHRLQAAGATVIEMPAIEIGPPSNWEGLDNAIACIQTFDWLILTSTNGVDYFFERLFAQGKDARSLAQLKIAVVGKKTANSLKLHNLQPDFIPPNFVADSLVEHFPASLQGKKVLFPRVETGGREVLVQELSAKGAEVVEVAAYESRCPDAIAPEAKHALSKQAVDIITFASSKTVRNFCQLVEASQLTDKLDKVAIASIGPQTSRDCKQLLGRVDVEALEYTLEGLTQAIINWATIHQPPV